MKKYVIYIENDDVLNIVELGDLVFKYNMQYRVRLIYQSKPKFILEDWEWSIAFTAPIYKIIATFSNEDLLTDILEKIKSITIDSCFLNTIELYIENKFPEYTI